MGLPTGDPIGRTKRFVPANVAHHEKYSTPIAVDKKRRYQPLMLSRSIPSGVSQMSFCDPRSNIANVDVAINVSAVVRGSSRSKWRLFKGPEVSYCLS